MIKFQNKTIKKINHKYKIKKFKMEFIQFSSLEEALK